MPSRKNDQASSRRIVDALRLLVRDLRNSAVAAERTTGLSGAQLFVLRTLIGEPGLSVTALALRTLTHQSSVSVVVAKLTGSGLVERVRSADDARRLVLRATPAGRRIAAKGPDPIQDRLLAGLARLTPAMRRRLAGALTAWTAAAGLAEGVPPMFFETAGDD